MDWPKVESKSTKALTEYKFIGGSWFLVLMSLLMLSAVILPYFIVLFRGTLNPFLPFISQVSGSPPQSGVFNILLVLSSLLAFIGLHLLHMGIRLQKKRLNDDWVIHLATLLNNISLIPGHVGIAGMIIVGSYPLDAYRTSEEWVKITIVPHAIGALSLFLGGIFYCMIMTYILALIHPEQKQILGIRIFLICLITMCSVLQGITVNEGFWPSDSELLLKSCIIGPDSISYNLSYLIGALSEWCLVFIFIVFFLTLKDEARNFCFTMTVTVEDNIDDLLKKASPSKSENNHASSQQTDLAENTTASIKPS